jgi:membrane-bound ClpP family serine protease
MHRLLAVLHAVLAADPAAAPQPGWPQLAGAVLLVALAAVLLGLEFFVVSGGLLIIASFLSGFAACALAFSVSPAAGWTLVAATPLLALATIRWGLRRLTRSRAVPRAEVTEDAGYHHLAEQLGIAVGSVGELLTDAMPTGRARFAGRGADAELDVLAHGPALARGTRVMVLAISGPTVTVARAPASAPTAAPM